MLRIFAGVLLALTVRWLFRALRQDRRPIPEDALITDGRLLQIEGIDVHYRREGSGSPVVLAHGLLRLDPELAGGVDRSFQGS